MTRDQAVALLRRLSLVLERVSVHGVAEVLRDALTEEGARALLDSEAGQ